MPGVNICCTISIGLFPSIFAELSTHYNILVKIISAHNNVKFMTTAESDFTSECVVNNFVNNSKLIPVKSIDSYNSNQ